MTIYTVIVIAFDKFTHKKRQKRRNIYGITVRSLNISCWVLNTASGGINATFKIIVNFGDSKWNSCLV
jgi:cytidylate kinase